MLEHKIYSETTILVAMKLGLPFREHRRLDIRRTASSCNNNYVFNEGKAAIRRGLSILARPLAATRNHNLFHI